MYVGLRSSVEKGELGIKPKRPSIVEQTIVLGVEDWETQRLVLFRSALGQDLETVLNEQCSGQGPIPVPSASTSAPCWCHRRYGT